MQIVLDLQGAQSHSRRRGIGRYSRNLALALARSSGAHEPGAHALHVLLNGNFVDETRELQSAFHGLLPPGQIKIWYGPGRQSAGDESNTARRHAAERIRAAAIRSLEPDIVLLGSLFEGLSDDAVTLYPGDEVMPPTVAVCYDLIPLINPAFHFRTSPARDWYGARLEQMRRMVGLLAVSQSSQAEVVRTLGYPEQQVRTVMAGVAPSFHPKRDPDGEAALLARYRLPPGFILCIGTVEPRKNLDGLIRAYALLPPRLRRQHCLVATGWNDVGLLGELRQTARHAGLGADEIILLDQFVAEEDLPRLYRACALSVSPSLHEGFGLSAAEAMACGVPVIGSNTTSLPEVIGEPQALFDPANPYSIAERMRAVLTQPALRDKLVAGGLDRVRAFTWPRTAELTWRALEAFHAATAMRDPTPPRRPRRLSLGVVAPLLGGPTPGGPLPGLTALTAAYDIELISEDPAPPGIGYTVHGPSRLAGARFDRVLYWPCDDPRHLILTLKLLPAFPGIVVRGPLPVARVLQSLPGGDGDAALANLLLDLFGWQAAVALHDDAEAAGQFRCERAFDANAVGQIGPNEPPERFPARIEAIYASGQRTDFEGCMRSLTADRLRPADIPSVAAAVAATFRPTAPPALLLDVSSTARFDAATGIQRAVREILRHLGRADLAGYRLEPIRIEDGQILRAQNFAIDTLGLPYWAAPATPPGIGPGDILIALDLTLHDVDGLRDTIDRVRRSGGRAAVVVYDLLPLRFPDYFAAGIRRAFPRWLEMITTHADALLCISRTVADELIAWLQAAPLSRMLPLDVAFFHLGADFQPMAPLGGVRAWDARQGDSKRDDARREAAKYRTGETAPLSRQPRAILMVGTIEPRKGHRLALAAFDRLWARGIDVVLVIAGRTGWMMEAFQAELQNHPEFGDRLLWFDGRSDEQVQALYRSAAALLVASEGEGFGLPIVEAARFGIPIIARDIPVFREVAGDAATFFPGDDSEDLACTIEDWLERQQDGRIPDPAGVRVLTWSEAAAEFLHAAIGDRPYYTWLPARKLPAAPASVRQELPEPAAS